MPKKIRLYPSDREALQQVREWIEQHPSEMYCLSALCSRSGLNRDKLKKGFKLLFSLPPYQYHIRIKMQEALRVLKEGDQPVSDIAYFLGYSHVSSFCTEFKKYYGYSPACYRNHIAPENDPG